MTSLKKINHTAAVFFVVRMQFSTSDSIYLAEVGKFIINLPYMTPAKQQFPLICTLVSMIIVTVTANNRYIRVVSILVAVGVLIILIKRNKKSE